MGSEWTEICLSLRENAIFVKALTGLRPDRLRAY